MASLWITRYVCRSGAYGSEREIQEFRKAAGPDRPEFDAPGDDPATVLFNGDAGPDAIVIDLQSGKPLVDVQPVTSIEGGLLTAPQWERAVKRLLDVVGASIALILFLPVLLLAAAAVATTSRGPVLFGQERIGLRGQPFRMLKFRSMYRDAETQRDSLKSLNYHETGPIFKIRDDPRITPVGRVIRRLSIDELPQFLNVLGGSMSLVGPRPPLSAEAQTYDDWERQRLLVKPGITCIWQVSGRSELDFETWVRMDLQYIETWSFWLDFKLLARTIPAVVSARGAY